MCEPIRGTEHIIFFRYNDVQLSVMSIAYAMKDARFASICFNLVHVCAVPFTGYMLNLVFLEHGLICVKLRTISLAFRR